MLASAIVQLSEGAHKLLSQSPLTERALLLLIHDAIPPTGRPLKKLGKADIKRVLQALPELKKRYVRGQR